MSFARMALKFVGTPVYASDLRVWFCAPVYGIVVVVLLAAATLKAQSLINDFPHGGSVITNPWLTLGIIEAELFLALWLWSGWRRSVARRTAIASFLMFAVFAGYKAFLGRASCGCFGNFRVNPWLTFTFDVSAVLALVYCRPMIEQPVGVTYRLRLAWSSLTALTLTGAAAIAIAAAQPRPLADLGEATASGLIVLEPEHWVGRPLSLLDSIDTSPPLRTGSWAVILYRHDCDHCRAAIPGFERQARSGKKVALIEMPPYAAISESPISPSSECLLGKLSDKHEWFAQTPVVILLEDGVVKKVAQGEEAVQESQR